jgi:uncharacterized repeat protein (TIGR01451 family)
MRTRVVLILTILGLAMAVTASPVAAGEALFLDISDSPDPVFPGGTLTYTITVNSTAGVPVQLNVIDPLPAGTTLQSASATTGVVTEAPTLVVWAFDLAGGATETLTILVVVDPATPAGTILQNTAQMDALGQSVQVTEETTVAAPPQIAMTDAPDPVVAGTNLTYTIDVQNSSAVDWTDVLMQTGPATGSTFVSFSAPAGWTTVTPPVGGTGTVSATRPTLSTADGVQTFTFVVHVDAALAGGTILPNGAALGCCDGGGVVTAVQTTVLAAPPSPTPAASLPNAATVPPEPGSSWMALGFAALLIGTLCALVVANAHGVARRR